MKILSTFLFFTLIFSASLTQAQIETQPQNLSNQCEKALATSTTLFEKLKVLGIDAKVEKTEPKETSNLGDVKDRYLLRILFGRLTQTQFNAVHSYLGGKSKVTYNKGRSYELTDFLSPLQQALINKTFESYTLVPSWGGDREFKNEGTKWSLKNGVEVFANCWNTAWEITRANHPENNDKNYYLYWPGRWEADDVLKSQDYSSLVEEADIQSGDMLIVSAKNSMAPMAWIQHAAIFVTPDIVFEKTNGSKDDPFRLAFTKDVLEKYKTIFSEEFNIEIRRFNQPGQKPLPAPDLKEDPKDDILKEIREIPEMQKHPGPLHFGAEVGLGGGQSPSVTGILIFQVEIDPKTSRGALVGQTQDLSHFKNLE